MASKRFTFKKAIKKAAKRSRAIKRRQPVVAIGREINHAFPRMMKFTHRYTEVFSLTSSTGIPNVVNFSANGMFDPNVTGGGKQPMAFDNMTALYNHYCVVGSKITVKCTPISTTNPAAFFGIYINDNTTAVPTSSSAYLANTSSYVIMPTGGSLTKSLGAKWSARKMFGRGVLANTDLQGTSAANPAEQSYFTLFFAALDEASNTGAAFVVDIEYIAIWKEPKDLDLS